MSNLLSKTEILFFQSIGVEDMTDAIKKLGVVQFHKQKKEYMEKYHMSDSRKVGIKNIPILNDSDFELVTFLKSDYELTVNRHGDVKHRGRKIIGQISVIGSNARRLSYTLNGVLKTIQRTHLIWNHFNPNDHVNTDDGDVIIFIDNKRPINTLFALDNIKKIKKVEMTKHYNLESFNDSVNLKYVNVFYKNYDLMKITELVDDLKNDKLSNVSIATKYDTSEMSISRARKKLELKSYLVKI